MTNDAPRPEGDADGERPSADDAARHRRIEDAFDAAIAVGADAREAVLASIPLDDGERREVLDLLRFHRDDDSDHAAARTLVGATIGGCAIEALVGVGGMGAVYRARQAAPARTVAVKVVDESARSAGTLRRFRNEAEILSQLEHPGIARIYSMGTHRGDDGATWPFIVMEFVEGARPVTAAFRSKGAASAEDLRARVAMVAEIAEAVAFGHGRGVIHRDLKPANILVDGAGRPRVIDFGIAKVVASGAIGDAGETLRTHFLGTPQYMAPEQFAAGGGSADVRVDVHALGLILHELVAGEALQRIPRGTGIVEAAHLAQQTPPSRLRALCAFAGADLEAVVAKATAREAEARYASMAEFARDLRAVLADEPVTARPAGALRDFARLAVRHRVAVAGVAVGLAALVVATAVSASAARVALRESRAARIAAAHASLRAAAAAFAAGDPAGTVAEIAATPTDMRAWESRHLLSALGNLDLVERTDAEIIDLCAIEAPREGDADAVVGCTGGVLGFVDLDRVRPSEWLDLRPFQTAAANLFFRGIDASADGRRIVATFSDGSVLAIDRDRDEVRRVASGQSTAFLAGDAIVAIDYSARTTRIGWDGAPLGEVDPAGASWARDHERSRDRSTVALALHDGSLRVLRVGDGATPALAMSTPPRGNGARVAALSPDGARVYEWSADGRLSAYDTRDGTLLAERDLPGGSVFDMRVSHDGRTLAASSWVPTIRLIDTDSLEVTDVLGGTHSHVWGIDFLPDGRLLGRCVLEVPPEGARAPEWLAAWRTEGSVAVEDRALGRGIMLASAVAGTSTVFLLDERGDLSELDARTGDETRIGSDSADDDDASDADGDAAIVAIGAGPTGDLLATVRANGVVQLHAREAGRWGERWSARAIDGTPSTVGISPDGGSVVVGTRELKFAVVDAASGAVRWNDGFERDPMLVDREQLSKPLFADRGRTLVFAAIRGEEPLRFQRLADGARVPGPEVDGRFQAVDGGILARDGTLLLLGYTGPLLEARADGTVRQAPLSRNQGVLALDAGEGRIFAATRDGSMRVIATSTDVSEPTALLALEAPASRPLAIAYDAARDAVIVVAARGIVRTWFGRLGGTRVEDGVRGLAHTILEPDADPDTEPEVEPGAEPRVEPGADAAADR
ncbi:MAG: Serine/threonine-protein kinase PrkC [Planctomycetota bacterium]